MVTKEQRDTELSESTDENGNAVHDTVVLKTGRGKRRPETYPISGRVEVEHLSLIDEAAQRREMKRGELVVMAVLQFIGKGHAGARKIRVEVPDEVRAEVRAAQTASDQLALQLKRLGNNVLPQLKRYWADEHVSNAEVIELLERIDASLGQLNEKTDAQVDALRSVVEREAW